MLAAPAELRNSKILPAPADVATLALMQTELVAVYTSVIAMAFDAVDDTDMLPAES